MSQVVEGLCILRCVEESCSLISNHWASLVAQMVKNLPAMWETRVRSLGQEDPLEKDPITQRKRHTSSHGHFYPHPAHHWLPRKPGERTSLPPAAAAGLTGFLSLLPVFRPLPQKHHPVEAPSGSMGQSPWPQAQPGQRLWHPVLSEMRSSRKHGRKQRSPLDRRNAFRPPWKALAG